MFYTEKEDSLYNIRQILSKISPQCVPYIGLYFSDLAKISESIPTLINNTLINFKKNAENISHFYQY